MFGCNVVSVPWPANPKNLHLEQEKYNGERPRVLTVSQAIFCRALFARRLVLFFYSQRKQKCKEREMKEKIRPFFSGFWTFGMCEYNIRYRVVGQSAYQQTFAHAVSGLRCVRGLFIQQEVGKNGLESHDVTHAISLPASTWWWCHWGFVPRWIAQAAM